MKLVHTVLSMSVLIIGSQIVFADELDCPTDKSPAKISAWRDKAVAKMFESSGGSEYSVYSRSNSALKTAIKTCFPDSPLCLKRLAGYVNGLTDIPYNNPQPIAEEEAMRTPPVEFQVPGQKNAFQLFQGAEGSPDYKDVEKIAKEKGWPSVRYKSRHSGGFDPTTPSLLMIRIPGEKQTPKVDYDQYINIALPKDPNETSNMKSKDVNPLPQTSIPKPSEYTNDKPTIMTMVTVKKKTDTSPARVLFNMFRRDYSTPVYKRDSDTSIGSCYGCHPNGLREISPLGYDVNKKQKKHNQLLPQDYWLATQEMNNSMQTNTGFGKTDWGTTTDSEGKQVPILDPEMMGPIMGPIHPLNRTKGANGETIYPTRTEEFIMGKNGKLGCAKAEKEIDVVDIFNRAPGRDNVYKLTAFPAIDYKKVAEAMNCGSCHNNRIRGSINSRTDSSTIAYKILTDQSMPAGMHANPLNQSDNPHGKVADKLNKNERIALYNCVMAEFKIEQRHWNEWLKQEPCDGNQSVSNSNSSAAVNTNATAPIRNSDPTSGAQVPPFGGMVIPPASTSSTGSTSGTVETGNH